MARRPRRGTGDESFHSGLVSWEVSGTVLEPSAVHLTVGMNRLSDARRLFHHLVIGQSAKYCRPQQIHPVKCGQEAQRNQNPRASHHERTVCGRPRQTSCQLSKPTPPTAPRRRLDKKSMHGLAHKNDSIHSVRALPVGQRSWPSVSRTAVSLALPLCGTQTQREASVCFGRVAEQARRASACGEGTPWRL